MSRPPTSNRARRTLLDARQLARLRPLLEAVVASADRNAQLARDPIAAVHRYSSTPDREVAAVFASVLAFGRVAAFQPVVAHILDLADSRGGPRAFVAEAHPPTLSLLDGLRYRWIAGTDLAALARALGRIVRVHGSLAAVFVDGPRRSDRLASGVAAIRAAVLVDQGTTEWASVSRGLRYLLPHPDSGSACKRWCMFLRWMVRPPGEDTVAGLDLGLWPGDPARLVMPIDTHTLRIGQMVGLTARKDASWKTALDLTDSLAQIDPTDPLRYDFAVAHLGISGGCRGRWVTSVCTMCGLRPVCREAR